MAQYTATVNGHAITISLGDDGRITRDGKSLALQVAQTDSQAFSVLAEGRSHSVVALRIDGVYHVLLAGKHVEVSVETARTRLLRTLERSAATAHRRLEIRAPMPALIVRVEVQPGDEVRAGQGLVVLEAMKMENELKAHQAGKVKEVLAVKGRTVEKGEPLIVLE
jgi:biotin carboxyl carrier protein